MYRTLELNARSQIVAALAAVTLAFVPAAPVWAGSDSSDPAQGPRSRLPAPSLAPGYAPVGPVLPPAAAPSGGTRALPRVSVAPGSPSAIRYGDLIRRSAAAAGADAAIVAALMEVEGSGERAVSPAGALGVMQLMPDKFRPGDDPFDPATNLFRAAQHIRLLQDRWGDPERVAAAYFGAIDAGGNVTGASDGNITGYGYVARFRAAYQQYARSLA